MAPLDIECLLVLNAFDEKVVAQLKDNVAPVQAEIKANAPKLNLHVEYRCQPFESLYPDVKQLIERGGYKNVLFNLDQYGHSNVSHATLNDITNSFVSAEIFYTFLIGPLLAFLNRTDPDTLNRQLAPYGFNASDITQLDGLMNNNTWLGIAERLVFNSFRPCAQYVSPFSINNPGGWRYWLIHFANSYRARQEYNNVLHENKSSQAHFGRSGLNMLAYDPTEAESMLYTFDEAGREAAKRQLYDDIPMVISSYGDAVGVGDFYSAIYNSTPAHMDDIHFAISENPDLEVVTEAGGERRKSNTIRVGDTLKLRSQKSFFPLFGDPQNKSKR